MFIQTTYFKQRRVIFLGPLNGATACLEFEKHRPWPRASGEQGPSAVHLRTRLQHGTRREAGVPWELADSRRREGVRPPRGAGKVILRAPWSPSHGAGCGGHWRPRRSDGRAVAREKDGPARTQGDAVHRRSQGAGNPPAETRAPLRLLGGVSLAFVLL